MSWGTWGPGERPSNRASLTGRGPAPSTWQPPAGWRGPWPGTSGCRLNVHHAPPRPLQETGGSRPRPTHGGAGLYRPRLSLPRFLLCSLDFTPLRLRPWEEAGRSPPAAGVRGAAVRSGPQPETHSAFPGKDGPSLPAHPPQRCLVPKRLSLSVQIFQAISPLGWAESVGRWEPEDSLRTGGWGQEVGTGGGDRRRPSALTSSAWSPRVLSQAVVAGGDAQQVSGPVSRSLQSLEAATQLGTRPGSRGTSSRKKKSKPVANA